MAYRIYIDTEKYTRIANSLRKLSRELGDCASQLGGVPLTRDAGADLNIRLSGSLESTGSRLPSGEIDDCVRAMQRLLRSMGSHSTNMASQVNRTADLFERGEREMATRNASQDVGEEAPFVGNGASAIFGGLASIISGAIGPIDAAILGPGGTIQNLISDIQETISDFFKDFDNRPQEVVSPTTLFWNNMTLQDFLKYGENVITDGDTTLGLIDGKLALFLGSELVATLGTKQSFTNSSFTATLYDGAGMSEFTGSLGIESNGKFKLTDLDRTDISDKLKNKIPNADKIFQKVDNPFSGRLNVLTVNGKLGYTESVFSLDGSISNEKGSVSGEVNVLKFNAEASGSAGLYAVKVGPDGKKTYSLSPGAEAKIGVSVTAFEANASANYEIIDGVKVNSNVGVTAGEASATAEGQIGWVDGDFAAYGKAEAELIGGEIKGDVSLDVLGVEGKVGASLNYGIGAHAEAGYKDGVLKVDVGASIGVGGSVSFEVDIGGAIDNVAEMYEGAKDTVSDFLSDTGDALKGMAEGFFSLF